MADLNYQLNPNKYSEYLPDFVADSNTSTASGFNLFFTNLVTSAITVSGILLLGYFFYGAIQWITAGGDTDKLDEAKKVITNAVTGMLIVAIVYFFTGLIGGILGINNILSPSFPFLRGAN